MRTITIRRIGYKRRGYTREDGTMVASARVPSVTFKTEDKGAPGRTPNEDRWYHPKVKMNWHKADTAETRRRNALKAHQGDVLATARALVALSNVTTDRPTEQLARTDARVLFKRNEELGAGVVRTGKRQHIKLT